MRLSPILLTLSVLSVLLAPVTAAQSGDVNPDWGSVSAKDGRLKPGCRDYRWRYEVTPPDPGVWDLSVSIVGPDGEVAWFGYEYEGQSATSGKETFRLCRSQSRPGRYKLKAVVSNEYRNEVETRRLETVRFRLR